MVRFSLVLVGSVFLSSGLSAKTLTCTVDEGEDSKGWVPGQFSLELSDDREVARVVQPKLEVFGAQDFEKGIFGSDYWARGKGRSHTGDYYNYRLQLILSNNDSRYKVTILQQGFRDLAVKGSCEVGNATQSTTRSDRPTVASNITRQDCEPLIGQHRKNPSSIFYAFLKLGLIDPDQSLRDINASPVLEQCIDKFRGEFPPMRKFINNAQYKKPLSASECKIIDWEHRFKMELMLIALDETFKNESWNNSPQKAVYDWCSEIFEK